MKNKRTFDKFLTEVFENFPKVFRIFGEFLGHAILFGHEFIKV